MIAPTKLRALSTGTVEVVTWLIVASISLDNKTSINKSFNLLITIYAINGTNIKGPQVAFLQQGKLAGL